MLNELIDSGEDLYARKRQCEVNLKQGIDSEDRVEVRRHEIRMSHKDGMMLNSQYGVVELKMGSRDDSNMNTIVQQGIVVRSDEAMNARLEEGTGIIAGHQWRRHLYVLNMYMGRYWHMDNNVCMQ